jgi:hypothetical protein
MSDTEVIHSRIPNPEDTQVVQYHAVSAAAVIGLLLGLAAATALLSPVLWLVALVAVAVNVFALARIAREAPALVGYKAALAGLLLSLFFGSVAIADWYTYSDLLRREAKQFAALWFDSLRQREPQKAHQLTQNPGTRRPFDNKLWEPYFEGSDLRDDLKGYLGRPEVRALMNLGDKAQVRYYGSPTQSQDEGRDTVSLVYAVTYPEGQQKATFFINLVLERHRLASPARAEWRVVSSEGGVGPDGKAKTQ